jgi:hypothetical protein
MFGISLTTFGLLILWALFTLLVLRMQTPLAKNLRPRLFTFWGFFLVGCGFFFQSWIKFDFMDYLNLTPAFMNQIFAGGIVIELIKLLGVDWISKLLHIFHMFTAFNGWQIEFIPTLGFWIRLCTLLPLFPFVLSIFGILVGSSYRGSSVARGIGGILIISGSISALALLLALPGLDSLGIRGNFPWTFLATILGSRMGNGPWFCILGLLLIILGGFIEVKDMPSTSATNADNLT